MARSYAVLGGGVLGLTVALRLLRRGHTVRVFEREAEPGGLAAGFVVEPEGAGELAGAPVYLEKFYHHLFTSDRRVIALIHELGLGDALVWPRPKTVTLLRGHVTQLDSPASVLRFRPISPVARLRLAAGLAVLKLLPSPAPLEGRRAAPWIRGVMGGEAYDAVWGPLLKGKFGAVADEIALPWFWARVHDRTSKLGYVRGGFQRFYDRLAARVRELGGEIALSTEVARIAATADAPMGAVGARFIAPSAAPTSVEITHAPVGRPEASRTERFDRVVSTLPTRLTCRLAPELPADYRAKHDWGRAYGAHCLILALDRPMTASYWMNVNDPGYPFMVFVEHTNYMPPADYGGRHLIYLGNYRPMDDPLFAMGKEQVLAAFLPSLARINPAFEPGWVTESWMFAAPFAQPIVTTDYREHIPPFDTPLPGLYLANMFQVYPHDRGQNYSVELAERLVERLEG